MSTILSLDPGGTTGYAIFHVEKHEEPELLRQGQIAGGLNGFLDFHWDVLEDIDFDVIVCESFTLREGVYGANLDPVYIIGALEALYPTTEIVYQSPALKKLCEDDRLKTMGLHVPGKPHRNDAVRHLVVYLRNKKHLPTLKLGWANDTL